MEFVLCLGKLGSILPGTLERGRQVLLQLLVVCASECETQMGQSLKLVRFDDGQRRFCSSGLVRKHRDKLVRTLRKLGSTVIGVLVVAVVQKFDKALGESLEVDEQLLFVLKRVEVLFRARQLEQEERVFVVRQLHGQGLLRRLS